MEFNKVNIITAAKVASANFIHCRYNRPVHTYHGHDVRVIKNTINNERNCLMIVGVRNPIDRNLSYLFQTFDDNFLNDVRTRHNNYQGEYCYIPEMKGITDPATIADLYFKQKYHNTFNEWFEEFLDITGIGDFDRERGLDFYQFPNNNTIMIYTVEKLNDNKKFICNILGISDFTNANDRKNDLYTQVKSTITYTSDYVDTLLNTKIMDIFYTKDDIEMFRKKIKFSSD